MKGAKLAGLCKAQVGMGYVWGGLGYTLTEGRLAQLKALYPAHYTESYLAKSRKLLGRAVYDCAGLVKHFLWGNEGDGVLRRYAVNGLPDVTANGLLALCVEVGAIGTLPELPGLLVHRDGHVGIYAGGGKVVEARGIDFGVVETECMERGWKMWGKLPGVVYGPPAGEPASPEKAVLLEELMARLRAEGIQSITL